MIITIAAERGLTRLQSLAVSDTQITDLDLIQDRAGLAGEQRCESGYYLSHFSVQLGGLHFSSSAMATVNELAEIYLSVH